MVTFKSRKLARYRIRDGKTSIELKLKTPRQLFDERDPAPFRERDLDDDAARYIVNSYKEVKDHHDVKISLYFETLGEFFENPAMIEKAISAFFSFEADAKRRELKDIFRKGFISLLIGFAFLFTCTWFAHSLDNQKDLLRSMMHEGLFIMGWVAMWQPISIFLYEWWPIREAETIFKKISALEVEILSPVSAEQLPVPEKRAVSSSAVEFSSLSRLAYVPVPNYKPS